MDLQLRGKVALVTGGTRGIGLATARLFAQEGCHLGICGRDEAQLTAVQQELRALGARVTAVTADVTKAEDAARFVDRCVAELGGIDVLVNNVGGSAGGADDLRYHGRGLASDLRPHSSSRRPAHPVRRAPHEESWGRIYRQRLVYLRLVAPANGHGAIRGGQGRRHLPHRAAGVGDGEVQRARKHRLAGVHPAHAGMGYFQRDEPGGLRPVRAGRVPDGPVGQPRGVGRRNRLHVIAKGQLDQWSEYTRGRTGAAHRGGGASAVVEGLRRRIGGTSGCQETSVGRRIYPYTRTGGSEFQDGNRIGGRSG